MTRFACTPFKNKNDQSSDGMQFYVRAETSEEGVEQAKEEALRQGFPNVFVEDPAGLEIYNGPVGDSE